MYNIPNTFDAYANKPGGHYNPYSTKLEISRPSAMAREEFFYEDGLPGNHFNTRTIGILLLDLVAFGASAVAYFELAQIHQAWIGCAVFFVLGFLWTTINLFLVCTSRIVGQTRISSLTKYMSFRNLAVLVVLCSGASFGWFIWEILHEGKIDGETKHLKFMKKMSHFYYIVGGIFVAIAIHIRCSQAAYAHAVKRWTTFNKYQNLMS